VAVRRCRDDLGRLSHLPIPADTGDGDVRFGVLNKGGDRDASRSAVVGHRFAIVRRQRGGRSLEGRPIPERGQQQETTPERQHRAGCDPHLSACRARVDRARRRWWRLRQGGESVDAHFALHQSRALAARLSTWPDGEAAAIVCFTYAPAAHGREWCMSAQVSYLLSLSTSSVELASCGWRRGRSAGLHHRAEDRLQVRRQFLERLGRHRRCDVLFRVECVDHELAVPGSRADHVDV
jgi:hypothetical protein